MNKLHSEKLTGRSPARLHGLLGISLSLVLAGCFPSNEPTPDPGDPNPGPGNPSEEFAIGGTLNNLDGSVELALNDTHKQTFSKAGAFHFATPLQSGSDYAVSVVKQPDTQRCSVEQGAGKVDQEEISTVRVECVDTYRLGGTLTGLPNGGTLELRLIVEGSIFDTLSRTEVGDFFFSKRLFEGTDFTVAIIKPEEPQDSCSPKESRGTMAAEDNSSLAINCITSSFDMSLSFPDIKTFQFNWEADETADSYRLYESAFAGAGFTQIATLPKNASEHRLIVPLYARSDAAYYLECCNDDACSDPKNSTIVTVQGSSETNPNTLLTSIGFVKTSNNGDANDWLPTTGLSNNSISLSDNGRLLAVGAPQEDSFLPGPHDGSTAISNGNSDLATDSGAVYLYRYTDTDGWKPIAFLKPYNNSDLVPKAHYGTAVSLSGDGRFLAVGAPGKFSDNVKGQVYVYDLNSFKETFRTTEAELGALGYSLSLDGDGDRLVVGQPLLDQGKVRVYERSGDSWAESAEAPAQSASDEALGYGVAVSLSEDGDLVAVGRTNLSQSKSGGSVDIYQRDDTGWQRVGGDTKANGHFGSALSLAGNGKVLAVGDLTGNPNSTTPNAGIAYLYTATSPGRDSWSPPQSVEAINATTVGKAGAFGRVSLSDDGQRLAVGSGGGGSINGENGIGRGVNSGLEDDGGGSTTLSTASGAAYTFVFKDGAWQSESYLKASNPGLDDAFGRGVTLSGDGNTLAVLAPFEDSNAQGVTPASDATNNNNAPDTGAVYLY